MATENFNIDYSFLEQSEKFTTTAYVPSCTAKSIANKNPVCAGKHVGDAIGKSGLTIGTGVDLGQMNEYDLKKLKLPDHLNKALKPYLTKKGADAQKLNLQLSASDARLISNKVKDLIISHIVKNYETDSGKQFNALNINIQTAIIDYFYQFGQGAMYKEPHDDFWDYLINAEWAKAVTYLEDRKDYKDRRTKEANLIKNSPEFK